MSGSSPLWLERRTTYTTSQKISSLGRPAFLWRNGRFATAKELDALSDPKGDLGGAKPAAERMKDRDADIKNKRVSRKEFDRNMSAR
jgi:hypothetical protein